MHNKQHIVKYYTVGTHFFDFLNIFGETVLLLSGFSLFNDR